MIGRLSKESSTRSNNTKAEQKWVFMRPIVPEQGTGPARHLGAPAVESARWRRRQRIDSRQTPLCALQHIKSRRMTLH